MTALAAERLTSVPAVTYGPYSAASATGAIVAWAALDAQGVRRWSVAALDGRGVPRKPPRTVAETARELGVVIVRPTRDGFALVSSRAQDGNELLELLRFTPDGDPQGPALALTETPNKVLWIELVATSRGALVFWAIRSAGGADLYVQAVGQDTKSAAPKLVQRGAGAWQVAQYGSGAALAVVPAAPKKALGPVHLLTIGEDGVERGAPLVVNAGPNAAFDLDMIAADGRLLLAWSDQRELEARVYLAAIDANGKAAFAPRPAIDGFGEQALVRLVPPKASGSSAYLVWESLLERAPDARRLQVAALAPDGTLSSVRGELEMAALDGSIPEFEATQSGLAALTLAPLCPVKGACTEQPSVPFFVQLGRDFAPSAAEPMRLAPLKGEIASLAWGLNCASGPCWSLAALGTTPAPVFAVQLRAQGGGWQAPARQVLPPEPPLLRSMQALRRTDPLSDVAATRIGESLLSAWVTYFDPAAPYERLKTPAPDGRYEPLRAELGVYTPAQKGPLPPVSLRARSLGGVTLSASQTRPEALLGWTAIDNGQPQVFVTLLSADGRKLGQRMLTRQNGEVSDVASASVADGYVIGWIDERHGNPEVYLAKLKHNLERFGAERRVTTSAGAASELALLGLGNEVLLSWADARSTSEPGTADIYLLRVNAADGAPASAEERLLATRGHSHSPALGQLGDGTVAIAWIESDADENSSAPSSALRVGFITSGTRLSSPPLSAELPDAAPVALALDCARTRCNLLVLADGEAGRQLFASHVNVGGTVAPFRKLIGIGQKGPETVAPVLLGSDVLYADRVDGEGLVRSGRLQWD